MSLGRMEGNRLASGTFQPEVTDIADHADDHALLAVDDDALADSVLARKMLGCSRLVDNRDWLRAFAIALFQEPSAPQRNPQRLEEIRPHRILIDRVVVTVQGRFPAR